MEKKRSLRKTIMIILAVVVALALIGTAFAEFTKSFRTKRVVAAVSAGGMLFSSNYMLPGAVIPISTRYLSAADAADPSITHYDMMVSVSNFAQGNPGHYYSRNINYTLTASIVTVSTDGGGNTVTTPVIGSPLNVRINDAAMLASYNGTLTTGSDDTDNYKLSLPREMLTGEKCYVLLTATPTGDYHDLSPIRALFDLGISPETATLTWSIDPTDDRGNDVSEYSGYNFRLSGSGKGTIKLGWKSSKLKINRVFFLKVGAVNLTAGQIPDEWGSGYTGISFEVDADDINSYDIQFFPADTDAISVWSEVDVKMSFEEDTGA